MPNYWVDLDSYKEAAKKRINPKIADSWIFFWIADSSNISKDLLKYKKNSEEKQYNAFFGLCLPHF